MTHRQLTRINFTPAKMASHLFSLNLKNTSIYARVQGVRNITAVYRVQHVETGLMPKVGPNAKVDNVLYGIQLCIVNCTLI